MNIPSFKRKQFRLVILVAAIALLGPVFDIWGIALFESYKFGILQRHLCNAIESRVQVGAVREAADFFISSLDRVHSPLRYQVVIIEREQTTKLRTERGNLIKRFDCEFAGRKDFRIQVSLFREDSTLARFLMIYIVTVSLLYLLIILIGHVLRSFQMAVVTSFESTLASNLSLFSGKARNDKNLSVFTRWYGIHSTIAGQINDRVRILHKAIDDQAAVVASQRAAASLGAIAAQVAHDIRSPLSALNAVASKLQGSESQYHGLLISAVKRIDGIAQDILLKSRLPKDHRDSDARFCFLTNDTPANMGEILESVISEKQIANTECKVRFKISIEQIRGLDVLADPVQLSRVLSNLLNNAIESICGCGEIEIAGAAKSGSLTLVISDTGKGIPQDVLRSLGKKRLSFGKESLSLAGTGMGISHAFSYIESVHGSIRLESSLGVGTKVFISLPTSLLEDDGGPITAPSHSLNPSHIEAATFGH